MAFTKMSMKQFCSVPMLLLVTIAALDSADKSLLAASFPVLSKTLGLNMEALGYFSLFGNLSYALSLPLWAYLVHIYTIQYAHNILCLACWIWGLATFGIASSTSIYSQAIMRCINGAALASILPLSQTMLVELVPLQTRGRAFGILGVAEKAAATLAVSAVVWCNEWRLPYVIVGVLSITIAIFGRRKLKVSTTNTTAIDDKDNPLTMWQTLQRIARTPSFACLVGQGVFGAIPWDIMSFLLLLLDWKGFTKDQIVMIQFTNGISGTLGGFVGGVLGDVSAQHLGMVGRVGVAFVSVVGGMLFYGTFLHSNSYPWSLVWSNLFYLWGSWTPAATNRPLCAELAMNSSERAQIVAAWILLEKTSAAIFGAPLVGYISKHMMDDESKYSTEVKAETLAYNMVVLSSLFWAICAAFWLLMTYLLRKQQPYEAVNQTELKTRV